MAAIGTSSWGMGVRGKPSPPMRLVGVGGSPSTPVPAIVTQVTLPTRCILSTTRPLRPQLAAKRRPGGRQDHRNECSSMNTATKRRIPGVSGVMERYFTITCLHEGAIGALGHRALRVYVNLWRFVG
jgi:hypothetical protein